MYVIHQAWHDLWTPWNIVIVFSVISFLHLVAPLCNLAWKNLILEYLKYAYGENFGRIDIAN